MKLNYRRKKQNCRRIPDFSSKKVFKYIFLIGFEANSAQSGRFTSLVKNIFYELHDW